MIRWLIAAGLSASVAGAPAAPQSATGVRAAAPGQKLVTVRAIRRTVLNDVVRVIIELDAEAPFHDERPEFRVGHRQSPPSIISEAQSVVPAAATFTA